MSGPSNGKADIRRTSKTFARVANECPKGASASSPRLRGTSYLGSRFENEANPNGVVAQLQTFATTPLGL